MNGRDQWDWLNHPIDPCFRESVVVKAPKCGVLKRIWNRITKKRDCDDE